MLKTIGSQPETYSLSTYSQGDCEKYRRGGGNSNISKVFQNNHSCLRNNRTKVITPIKLRTKRCNVSKSDQFITNYLNGGGHMLSRLNVDPTLKKFWHISLIFLYIPNLWFHSGIKKKLTGYVTFSHNAMSGSCRRRNAIFFLYIYKFCLSIEKN